MARIAVVEDDEAYRSQLRAYLRRFEEESGETLPVTEFADGMEITWDYSGAYDIVLMDIQMARMDWMQAAQKIRSLDKKLWQHRKMGQGFSVRNYGTRTVV